MPPDENPSGDGSSEQYVDGVDEPDALTRTEPDTLTLTPEQHEQLKRHLHGERDDGGRLDEFTYSDRRYLVIGKGGDGGPGDRRIVVRDQLDDRRGAVAFRLEDFGLTPDHLELWAPAFEILSQQATHIVGVLEDFDGGHVWELGFLYRYQRSVRDILWLLKRVYESDAENREKYDNGMAASHLAALEGAVSDRVIPWTSVDELREAVAEIP